MSESLWRSLERPEPVRVRVREGQHRDCREDGGEGRASTFAFVGMYLSGTLEEREEEGQGGPGEKQKRKVCPSEVTTIIPQWWSGPGGLGWLAPSDVEPRQKVVRYGAVRSDS